MGSGQRSGPVRRRRRRGKTSERASLIPKSTLSEIFSADDTDSDEDLELIDAEPAEPEPSPKRAPWWSVHPVPAPPRRASTSPPPLRRPSETAPEVPPLDALETPLSLLPPPVFESPSSDAPLVSGSEPPRPADASRFPVRVAAGLCVLGASVVFGFGLGRAPDANRAATPVTQAVAARPLAAQAAPAVKADAPARLPPSVEQSENPESMPSAEVISLDDVAEEPASAAADTAASAARAAKPSGQALIPAARTALPAFDSALAASAINAAAERAAACRATGDPQGVAMVVLKYAPSGRVTTAVIEGGPFAGTTVGGCIAMAFRGAQVPPFSGEPVTVRKSVTYP